MKCNQLNLPITDLYLDIGCLYFLDKEELRVLHIDLNTALVDDGYRGIRVACEDCCVCYPRVVSLVKPCIAELSKFLKTKVQPIWQTACEVCEKRIDKVVRVTAEVVVYEPEGEVIVELVTTRCPLCGNILSIDHVYEKLNKQEAA